MKYIFTAALVLLFLNSSFGQQDAEYTQYMYNTISINPAYAGSRNAISIAGLYRAQWAGIEGAPKTQTLNIHAPVSANKKIGLGLSIINDKIGPIQETEFDIDFSYTVNTSESNKLAFGLKAGGQLLDINFNKLNEYTHTDILLNTNIDNKFSPNVGVGIYYYNEKFYVGASAPNLLLTKHFDKYSKDNKGNSFLAAERINYYVISGYVFNINEDLKLKPALLLKAVSGAPLQLDTSANFLFREKLSLGLAYRWGSALRGLAGFQINNNMMLGFAYDWDNTDLGKVEFNSGSFEFVLRYEIFGKNKKEDGLPENNSVGLKFF